MSDKKNQSEEEIENIKDEEVILDEIISKELQKIAELEKLVNELEEKNKVLTDQNLRSVADIQNMKRRSMSDNSRSRKDGAVTLLLPMVKVLDDFARAFSHVPEELQENEFIISLQSIDSAFQKTIQENGVELFGDSADDFNADLHDSMMMDTEVEDGRVAQVFEKGVRYKGSVVRHAKVSVGSKK